MPSRNTLKIMRVFLCWGIMGAMGSIAGYAVASNTTANSPAVRADVPEVKISPDAQQNVVSDPLKAQKIVQEQKLQDELWTACKRRNLQACKQIGLTDEDIAAEDKWQQITARHKDAITRINDEAMEARTENSRQELIRLQNKMQQDDASFHEFQREHELFQQKMTSPDKNQARPGN
jgi:hypothetical protein